MKKRAFLIACLYIVLQPYALFGYDDQITHPAITRKAASSDVSSLNEYLKASLGFSNGLDAHLPSNSTDPNRTILKLLTQGSTDEDSPACRASNHFHDPLKSWDVSYMTDAPMITRACSLWEGWTQHYSNITWGTGYQAPPPDGQKQTFTLPSDKAPNNWDNARTYFYSALTSVSSAGRETNFAKTFQAVGQVMHLLQDMAVPAHVRNDMWSHLEVNNYNPETPLMTWFNNAYELFVKNHLSLVNNADVGIINSVKAAFTNPRLTDFWDTNQYNGSILTANLGLSEFTNLNYLSDETIPTPLYSRYPWPHISIFDYQVCRDLKPGSEGSQEFIKTRKYISRRNAGYCPDITAARTTDHFAAVSMWSEIVSDIISTDVSKLRLYLDDNVHNTYAKDLLPRAVGYSAALLDYFFRGALEITAPDRCLYGLIDGSSTPYTDDYGNQHQQFTALKAKVKNASYIKDQAGNNIGLEEIKTGTIQAVAKYKIRTNYEPGLSTDPPTRASRESAFSYSVSAPLPLTAADMTALNSATPKEFSFNFNTSPIPAGITDLYLQVVFKGTLGNEVDNAIAVGMKDLSEPMHHVYWNATDGFYLDGIVRTADQIKGTPALLSRVDRNGDGILEEHIDPYPVKTEIAYCPAQGQTPAYDVIYDPMPEGTFGRLIIIVGADQTEYPLVVHRISTSPLDELTSLFTSFNIINQENDGVFNYAQVYTFRGIAMHAGSAYAKSYPYSSYIWAAPWHAPANNSPIAATTVNP
jgi:hypothetical protein